MPLTMQLFVHDSSNIVTQEQVLQPPYFVVFCMLDTYR